LRTGEEKVVVSYPVELLEEHIIYAALGYRYPGFGQQESRQLQPEWIDENTISYLDFETRERVVVNLDTLGWQTYRNEEFGFEMKYPEEWTIMEGWGSNFEPSLVSFVNPDSTKLYKESADINVYVYRLEELGLPDLTSYLDNSERGLYDIEEILLGSYTGYEAWVPGHDTAYSIFVEHDEHIYEFHLESVFDLNDITDMERQILSTFRFVY
jgi:hypothetical protein